MFELSLPHTWWFFILAAAFNAYQLWQILLVDKAFSWLQEPLFKRYPPTGYNYRKQEEIPKINGVERLNIFDPAAGQDEWYPMLDNNGTAGQTVMRSGAYVITEDGASTFGNALRCPDCSPFWFLIANLIVATFWIDGVLWFSVLVSLPRSVMAAYHRFVRS